jgi:hypothetical protein
MKITAGCNLISLRMVKLAIEQGFALKVVDNVDVYGEMFNEQTGEYEEWTGTKVQIHYERSAHDEYTIVHQYLVNGYIFACPMSEYDKWYDEMYWYEDD